MKLLSALTLVLALGAGSAQGQEKTKTAYMVADAHLDTQWNWDVQATIKQHIWNTMVQNFMLFRQYPDYVFNFEGGIKYAWMKEYYPLQYEQVKKYVSEGRWHITGSSWDANEVIICSPESWMRNILLGQTFYRQEFGKECIDVFLPDCFGFPYTQPTLMAHCGLVGFSSQKLMWRTKPFYEGNKRYPFSVGLWEGIDGSKVMMVHGFDYAKRWPDEDLSRSEELIREIGESPLNIAYRYYGTGDIGGSPNIPSVRAVEKGIKSDGPVKIISATSDQLYKDLAPLKAAQLEGRPDARRLPEFKGELTMDLHGNGCYTSQAAMKLYNRQNEHLGDAAERSAVIADWLGACKYPVSQMTDTWRRVIWHQFHDDLTGTSIPRAYEFSWNDELISLKQFADVVTTSVSGIASRMNTQVSGTPLVVYNAEAFPVKTLVGIDATGGMTIAGPDGKKVPSQYLADKGMVVFEASLPSTGMAVYSMTGAAKTASKSQPGSQIENKRYRLRVDEYGDIESLYDKEAQRELVASGQRIRLVVFDDCYSPAWPAWEIQKATLDKAPKAIHDGVSCQVTTGSVCNTLTITKRYGETEIRQDIRLYHGDLAHRIDFETDVDWHSTNALLKAEFPLSVSNAEATYDLGLGSVKRGNNRDNQFEVYSHEWTDLTDRSGSYGVTILNNARYGWDKPNDNTLRHSLVYTPRTGNGYSYQAQQDMGRHVFTYSLIGHQGQLDEPEAVRQAAILNSPAKAFSAEKHKGDLGRVFSFVASDNDNVLIRALKRAETTDEYVVRVYETSGKQQQTAHLSFASDIVQAAEADGTEKTKGGATFSGRQLDVTINPYGVRTYKVKLADPAVKSQPSAADAQPLSLPFDSECFTFNEMREAANFEGGYSYAAELLPDDGLDVGGIHFQFGEKDALNGVTCKGQQLELPAGQYRHLYLLAASRQGDRSATFTFNSKKNAQLSNLKSQLSARALLACYQRDARTLNSQIKTVPSYTGFIGQWGHDGHTQGYLKDARLAYVGTHRHSATDDEAYEFTYMFMLKLDIPRDATSVQLPDDGQIVVFAATLANDDESLTPVSRLFETSLKGGGQAGLEAAEPELPSVLRGAKIIAVTGECNIRELAPNLTDGDATTKWCDVTQAPNYVVFDLGEQKTVSHWKLLNAGSETTSYITRTCLLQGRNSEGEEWQTLDMIDNNRSNEVSRSFAAKSVRYLRLFVVSPTQQGAGATRIYELEVY